MNIAMIAAMANNRIIGQDNQMPWHLPADLKHFKAVTMGHPVIMGRKTYESIGRLLPGRTNIIISRNNDFTVEGAVHVCSPEQALHQVADSDTVFIIGGGSIYQHFLPIASTLYLTYIDLDVAGDTQFPDHTCHGHWQLIDDQHHSPDEQNPYAYRFVTLKRN